MGGVAVNRILQSLEELPSRLRYEEDRLKDLGDRLESAKEALEKPFDKEEELRAKSDRLIELDSLLSLDERVPEIAASEPEEGADVEPTAPKSAVSEARAQYIQRNRGTQQDFVKQGGMRNAAFAARRAAVP